jgi:hypothetical protein
MIPNYGICKRNCSWYNRNMMTGISSRAHRCAASLEDDDASSAELPNVVPGVALRN